MSIRATDSSPEPATAEPAGGPTVPSAAFAAALNAGDPTAAAACFARDACLVSPDATTIRGRESIRALLTQLTAMAPEVSVERRALLISGPIALATETWTIRLNGLDLTPFARTAVSSTVMRRVEGTWKLQIAAPWGWGDR